MTLSISANEKYRRTCLVYLAVTAFCLLFSNIYEAFSHGVRSGAMIYMFLYPLCGGLIPILVLWLCKSSYPGRLPLNAYCSGIALLTLGSCLKGVFEIYGTTSDYVHWYAWIGGAMCIFGILSELVERWKRRKNHN